MSFLIVFIFGDCTKELKLSFDTSTAQNKKKNTKLLLKKRHKEKQSLYEFLKKI